MLGHKIFIPLALHILDVWILSSHICKGPHTPPSLKPTSNCLYPITLLPLVLPVWQKICVEHTASTCCLLHSMYVCMFCTCMKCNKRVAPLENRKWQNGVHRKTKRTQYSAPPTHRADWLAHRQSEWPYSQPTTNQRIQWLRLPTANLLRLCWIGADNIRRAPKASNTA